MKKCYICHVCGGNMHPTIEARKYVFHGISVMINDVHMFRCNDCGECILGSQEAKRIEEIVINWSEK